MSTVPGGVQGSYWSGYPKSGNPFSFDLTMTSFDSDHKEASSIAGVATLANYSGWVYWTRMEACFTKWNLGIMFVLVKYIKRIPVNCLLDQDGGLLLYSYYELAPPAVNMFVKYIKRIQKQHPWRCISDWNRPNAWLGRNELVLSPLFVLLKGSSCPAIWSALEVVGDAPLKSSRRRNSTFFYWKKCLAQPWQMGKELKTVWNSRDEHLQLFQV